MKRKPHFVVVALIALEVIILSGCAHPDPLALWNDNAPAKTALTEYVQSVTAEGSPDYIPPAERIAVFDLDGTLFLETAHAYFGWLMFEHRVLEDPGYKATTEQIAAAKAGRAGKRPKDPKVRERLVAEVYKGMTLRDFDAYVRKFMREDQPGFTGLKRGDAFYKPMVEVVNYLVGNGFTVYVVSGTDRLTIRPQTEALGLPPHQVIDSDNVIVASHQSDADGLDYTFKKDDELVLAGKNIVKNLQMNKVAIMAREIGQQPVLAFGNALTDASMVNYTIVGNPRKALGFMLLCDDTEREYGNAKKAEGVREACARNGWIPISMRDDWKTVFGDGVKKTKLP